MGAKSKGIFPSSAPQKNGRHGGYGVISVHQDAHQKYGTYQLDDRLLFHDFFFWVSGSGGIFWKDGIWDGILEHEKKQSVLKTIGVFWLFLMGGNVGDST